MSLVHAKFEYETRQSMFTLQLIMQMEQYSALYLANEFKWQSLRFFTASLSSPVKSANQPSIKSYKWQKLGRCTVLCIPKCIAEKSEEVTWSRIVE